MRILFYTILGTVGLCLAIAILVPSFFDLNTYKAKLYKLVESQTGYNLEIKENYKCRKPIIIYNYFLLR